MEFNAKPENMVAAIVKNPETGDLYSNAAYDDNRNETNKNRQVASNYKMNSDKFKEDMDGQMKLLGQYTNKAEFDKAYRDIMGGLNKTYADASANGDKEAQTNIQRYTVDFATLNQRKQEEFKNNQSDLIKKATAEAIKEDKANTVDYTAINSWQEYNDNASTKPAEMAKELYQRFHSYDEVPDEWKQGKLDESLKRYVPATPKVVEQKADTSAEPQPVDKVTQFFNSILQQNKVEPLTTQQELNKVVAAYGEQDEATQKAIYNSVKKLSKSDEVAAVVYEALKANKPDSRFTQWRKSLIDDDKVEEWKAKGMNPIDGILSDSGLPLSKRIGLSLSLLSAISSDIMKGYVKKDVVNDATSELFKTYTTVRDKVGEAAGEYAKENIQSKSKADQDVNKQAQQIRNMKNAGRYVSKDASMALLTAALQNDEELFESTLNEIEPEIQKAYLNKAKNLGLKNASTAGLGYDTFKRQYLLELKATNKNNEQFVKNINNALDIQKKRAEVKSAVHDANFKSSTDYINAINVLQQNKLDISKLKSELTSAETLKQINGLVTSYRAAVGGLSTTSINRNNVEGTTDTSTATSTSSTSGRVGGFLSNIGINLGGDASQATSDSKSKSDTTSGTSGKTTTVDNLGSDIVRYMSSPDVTKARQDIQSVKEELNNMINARLREIDAAIEALERQQKLEETSGQLSLFKGADDRYVDEFGAPSSKNGAYYTTLLNLV